MFYPLFLLFIIINRGYTAADEDVNTRDKKDVSSIKNLASSIIEDKFQGFPLGQNNWDYRNYPINNIPSGRPGWGYQGTFGGSYVSTYERNPGGYVYDRPQGGNWIKPIVPSYDDTVVIYPATGGATFTSGPGVSISSSYLPAPITPSINAVPIRPTVNLPQPAVPVRPLIPSVPTGPAVTSIATGPTITSLPSGPAINIPQRPVIAQQPEVISRPVITSFPSPPVSLPLTPIRGPLAYQYSSADGYNYDKPDVPFF
uniref:Uncharacterized protein n=1 Tax=Pristhesancus plagipennis TaxID=1955184 RepID=A0A2K8JS04_PRIPG|nr:secreted hypothetical protein [Pristhesancus plagipennis]